MSILEQIVAATQETLPRRKRDAPTRLLEQRDEYALPRRSLAAALSNAGLSIIAEIKRQSPSRGEIRGDLDVRSVARSFSQSGAAAISVLTEGPHFGGSVDLLTVVRRNVTCPILRKDFIVDPYQIVEARAFGADAVLLIAAALDAQRLGDLLDAVHDLGMDALVEIHDADELHKVDLTRVRVLGVNNRDLNTFNVHLDHAFSVFANLDQPVIRVCESGFSSVEDLRRAKAARADAVLVGEALMKAPDPAGLLLDWLEQLNATT